MMRTSHNNEIIIYWSKEDEAYLAEVPELAGCAADGQSYQEALICPPTFHRIISRNDRKV